MVTAHTYRSSKPTEELGSGACPTGTAATHEPSPASGLGPSGECQLAGVVPNVADRAQAELFRRGFGGKYDRDVERLAQVFAIHAHGNRLDAAQEVAAAMREAIEQGYPTVDECEHGKFSWEACIACYDDHLEAKLHAAVSAFSPTGAA